MTPPEPLAWQIELAPRPVSDDLAFGRALTPPTTPPHVLTISRRGEVVAEFVIDSFAVNLGDTGGAWREALERHLNTHADLEQQIVAMERQLVELQAENNALREQVGPDVTRFGSRF